MVLEGLGLPIFGRCDKLPNEALDLLVPLVMLDTVHQQGTANHLHVLFVQMPFESPMSQDVLPPAPAEWKYRRLLGGARAMHALNTAGQRRAKKASHPLLGLLTGPRALSWEALEACML